MKVLNTVEMREADRLTTERLGIPSQTLMENAGQAVAQFLRVSALPLHGKRIIVLCGRGNNGGDGMVIARKLREMGVDPQVFLFAGPSELRGDAAANFERLASAGAEPIAVRDVAGWEKVRSSVLGAKIIVDALLGTGLRGKVEGAMAQAIADINRRDLRHSTVVSVDVPSGISGDMGKLEGPAIVADDTVTFTAPKLGMLLAPASSCVGRLIVTDIGTTRELIEEVSNSDVRWIEPWEFREISFRRKRDSNKGNFGHALVIAGSVGKAGAAGLAAQAALRSGAGLVTAAVPTPVLPTVAGFAAELMTEPLPATDAGAVSQRAIDSGRLDDVLRGKNVLAMGPGMSLQVESQEFVRAVVARSSDVPIVLDADGLNAFAGRSQDLRGPHGLLTVTPHPGEMARVVGCTVKDVQDRRLAIALESAAKWQVHVILKGHQTVLATPNSRAWINSTGNPGMSTGGTGDVLTGLLAGLTAQFGVHSWPVTLALGIYVHGLAGDLAAAHAAQGPILASDLIRFIPEALSKVQAQAASY